MSIISKTTQIAGRELTLEVGRFAYQANAAVLGRYGETLVLATVVESSPRAELNYFPLTVDYVERLYAGGRIKGSRWVKREGRPSDDSILIGRLVDRSVRPLFPDGYTNEVQITITVLSVDLENDPDILSIITSSAALALSGIPWNGPVAAVRVALKEKTPFINPINGEREFSDLDLVVSATDSKVVMLEVGAKEVPEELLFKAVQEGKKEVAKIVDLILDLQKEAGITTRQLVSQAKDENLRQEIVKSLGKEKIMQLIRQTSQKKEGSLEIGEIVQELAEKIGEEKTKEIGQTLEKIFKQETREMVLKGERPDGRKIEEIREIGVEVGILPRTHGSALFRRGQTQVLSVTTLGAPSLQQLIESAEGEAVKRYIHHYSMPPYSIGETGRIGSPSRREIGHGALAERALEPVVPSEEKFPYTIRVVSEVLSSNGSTSMASTCGSSLSLMDAGVPIASPVAGVAMGLVTDKDHYQILTDIAGLEDFYGDMDFKVAGTRKGITGVQLDVKLPGLTDEIVEKTLEKARAGRNFILDKMNQVISLPREKISQYAPRVAVTHVAPEKIGEVIGPGGRVIRKIMELTGAQIDIEDDGTVSISGVNDQSVASAVSQIESLTKEIKVGEIYEGTVKRIQPFGAFVEILPGREGLVHVSKMASEFVADPSTVVSVGQKVKVQVIEIDEQKRVNLTMLFGDEAKKVDKRPAEKGEFRPRGFISPQKKSGSYPPSRYPPRRSRFSR